MIRTIFGWINRAMGERDAYAHCDIPCGIYDPHAAQVAALTVLRMNQLKDNLQQPDANNNIGRYTAEKERHAELVKSEVRIIWGDYVRPEHVEKQPDIHNTVFNIMKLASRNKQNFDTKAAEELVAAVQKFAEFFWSTKNVQTKKQASNQTVGGEIVYPVAS